MSRPYSKIVADYHRQYPHQVRLRNSGDWRFDHCSRAHYQVTSDRLVWWHEDGASVFGFKTADQAAAFQRWAEACRIDWTMSAVARAADKQRTHAPGLLMRLVTRTVR